MAGLMIAPTICRRVFSVAPCLAFALFVLTALCSFTLAEETNRPQIGHDYWGLKEGAPDSIEGLAQTSDGYLWLASPNGLVRFDGVRFERFRPPPGTELLSTNISKIFAPPSGGLWIGYRLGGFSFLNKGRLTNYAIDPSTGTVDGFVRDQHGIVWAITQSGVWRFEHAQWQRLGADWNPPPAGGSATALAFDGDGILWIIAGNTLWYLPAGARQFAQAEADLSTAGFPRTVGFTLDADGFVMTGKSWRPRGAPENGGPPAYPLLKADTRQLVDRAGGLWVLFNSTGHLWPEASLEDALNKSTLQLRKEVTSDGSHLWQLVSSNSSRVDNYDMNAYAALADREGNVWIGEAKGLHRFFYKPFVQVNLGSLFGSVGVGSDGQGGVWVGGQNSPLFHLRGGSEVTPIAKVESWTLKFVYSAPDGTVWVGAGETGLWHETLSEDRPSNDSAWSKIGNALFDYTGRNWVFIDLPKEVAGRQIFLQAITQDRRGGVWISIGRAGLYRYADGVWTPYGGRNDIPKTGVVSEFTDTTGRVWFGFTKNQLAVLDGDNLRVFGTNDGLRVGNVLTIAGRGPDVWIGGDFGLQRYSNGRLVSINAVDNQMLHGISGIIERANGDLWLNGITGVFHISQAEVSRALQDPGYRVTGEHFGVREGLPGYAPQLRPLPSAIEATNGRLWFAVNNGVVWLDPDNAQHPVPALPVTIQSVSADDKYYDLEAPLQFPARTSTVEINYVSVSLSAPQAVRYRYKLQETDHDWREVRTAEPVTFRNLAPGSYHFVVASSDTNGAWSDKVATLDFSIAPAFYQTIWFRLGLVVVAVLLVIALYRLRLRQATTRLKVRFDERLAERTRIARELHDTLLQTVQGSKMVADDALEQANDPAYVRGALEKLTTWLGQATQEGRAALNSLRTSTIDNNDLAAGLRRAIDECGLGETMAFKFSVAGKTRDMHPIARDELYRIGYEAIRNACEHSSASELDVHLNYANDLTLRVTDNGRGIEPSVVAEGKAGHFGLRGMRERAERIGSEFTLVSAPNAGTAITLVVPGKVIYHDATTTRLDKIKTFFRLRNRSSDSDGSSAY